MSMRNRSALFLATPGLCMPLVMLMLIVFCEWPVGEARAEAQAFVRIIHASPDVGTADVFVDGNKLLSNFQFGTVTPYVPVPPGPHKVQVALIGKGPEAAMITQTIAVEPGIPYTVAALGTQSQGFALDVIQDNNLVASGKAKLRIYNLSPNASLQSVTTSGTTLVSGMSYKDVSEYLALQAQPYALNITLAQNNTSTPFSAMLEQNTVTSIFAIGMLNGTPKLQFISEKVNGIPSMPGTGSDPNARPVPADQPAAANWQPAMVALGIIGIGIIVAGCLKFVVGGLLMGVVARKRGDGKVE